MTTRRELIIALGASVLTTSLPVIAQQQPAKLWRIGVLNARPRASVGSDRYDAAFVDALRDLGYVEGKNLVIDWRYAEGKNERLATLAGELVQLKVNVLVASSSASVQAATQATKTIPIVMLAVGDPVRLGFVESLSRPGRNVTGLTNLSADISMKHLELVHAAVPKLTRVALLLNPRSVEHARVLRNVQASARTSGVHVIPVEADTESKIEPAFGVIKRERAGALIVQPNAFFGSQLRQIAELATKHRLPSIYATREYAEVGGLMSYGTNLTEHSRRAAVYVDKILMGAKLAEFPVEQPTTFEMLINLKTAKALGITVPQELLLRADKVIE